tara:strand:- start:5 stop:397 length:393 start_codon:yes stop_codon:yes gene_type:complete
MDSYFRIFVDRMRVAMSIGIHDHEKAPEGRQQVEATLELFTTPDQLKATAYHDDLIDYEPLANAIREWEYRPHTDRLETLLFEMLEVCFADARVKAARVKLRKTEVFTEAEAAGIEVMVSRDEYEEMRDS